MPKTSLQKQIIEKGLRYAEIDSFLKRELAEDGYVSVSIFNTSDVVSLYIYSTGQRTQNDDGRKVKELNHLIAQRFNYDPSKLKCYFGRIATRGLSATAQCESLRYKLISGIAVRQAAYSILRFVMEAGARGCEVVVSGKIRGQRAKSMKFVDGIMIHAGDAAAKHVEESIRHVYMRQGMLGVRVKINKSCDQVDGILKLENQLPDHVIIHEPKPEEVPRFPIPFSVGADGIVIEPLVTAPAPKRAVQVTVE